MAVSPGEYLVGELADGGLRVALVERELVGGECSYWACIPPRRCCAPARRRTRPRGGSRRAGRRRGGAGLAGLHGLGLLRRRPGTRWLAGKGIDLLRGSGRLAGTGVVEVDGVRHTARHIVVATGPDPIVPPIPGLREPAALPALIAGLALELAPVRVNLIAPGFVDMPLSASLLGDQLEARRAQLRATLPIRRVVEPDDIAALSPVLLQVRTL